MLLLIDSHSDTIFLMIFCLKIMHCTFIIRYWKVDNCIINNGSPVISSAQIALSLVPITYDLTSRSIIICHVTILLSIVSWSGIVLELRGTDWMGLVITRPQFDHYNDVWQIIDNITWEHDHPCDQCHDLITLIPPQYQCNDTIVVKVKIRKQTNWHLSGS